MDKEKLYNAARSEAFDLIDPAHTTDRSDLVEAFVQGAEWLQSQPLSERLNEEEKEKIKAIYYRNVYSVEDVNTHFTEQCLIDAIFGSDLFNGKSE